MLLYNFTKLKKYEIMLNTFNRSLIIREPAIKTRAQEMNEEARTTWGAQRAEQYPHLGNNTLTPGSNHFSTHIIIQ